MRLTRRPPPPDARPLVRSEGRLLDGRVAIVTGGAGLAGSAICEQFASEGARVVVGCHRREAEAVALAERLTARGGQAIAVRADVRDAEEVRALVAKAVEQFGPVDVLVNNASAMPAEVGMKSFLEHAWADYQEYVDTVIKGAFHCSRAVLPSMVERRRGRIVNIGTTAVHEMNGHLNPYVTAKAGLMGMTRSLAAEFGRFGITVNEVVPSAIWGYERDPQGDEGQSFRDRSPLGIGMARPRDVAAAVVFLASDMAAAITGARIPVCAGQVMDA